MELQKPWVGCSAWQISDWVLSLALANHLHAFSIENSGGEKMVQLELERTKHLLEGFPKGGHRHPLETVGVCPRVLYLS